MLAQCHRLSATEFARVFKGGRILRHPLLQGRVLVRADGGDLVRAAFVAPKKIGKATRRNRVRRRVRERFRLGGALQDRELFGCDLVFVIMPEAETALPEALERALGELLRRARREVGSQRIAEERLKSRESRGVGESSASG